MARLRRLVKGWCLERRNRCDDRFRRYHGGESIRLERRKLRVDFVETNRIGT